MNINPNNKTCDFIEAEDVERGKNINKISPRPNKQIQVIERGLSPEKFEKRNSHGSILKTKSQNKYGFKMLKEVSMKDDGFDIKKGIHAHFETNKKEEKRINLSSHDQNNEKKNEPINHRVNDLHKFSIHNKEALQGNDYTPASNDQDVELIMIGEVRNIDIKKEIKKLLMKLIILLIISIPFIIQYSLAKNKTNISGAPLLEWVGYIIIVIFSHFATKFIARFVSYILTEHLSFLLFKGNILYYAVALHPEIAFLLWATILLAMWISWLHTDLLGIDELIVRRVLKCLLALRIGILLKGLITLYIATSYLWKPYLRRVRRNIFAQYALLFLMDYCTKGSVNPDDEDFALTISNEKFDWEQLSLYAISKAITYIPRNKIRNNLGVKDSSLGEILQSDKQAEQFAKHLFRTLLLKSDEQKEFSTKKFQNTELGDLHSWSEKFMGKAKLSSPLDNHKNSFEEPQENSEPQRRLSMNIQQTAANVNRPIKRLINRINQTVNSSGKAGMRNLSLAINLNDDDQNSRSLEIDEFCHVLKPELLKKVFSLFDVDGNGNVNCEEVVASVVRIFKNHQSLALTLRDSHFMAHKLSEIIGFIIFIILVVSWLIIFKQDIQSILLTCLTALVAISFLIGPSSANLLQSVIFIFVMRPYDVGDRVFHWIPESNVMQNSIVTRIDLQKTHFKSWDEKVYYVPNSVLATRTVFNIQRSGDQWHEFFIQIKSTTPTEKIVELKMRCQEFVLPENKPPGLVANGVKFALVGIENSSKLTIRICFQQSGNWQVLARKWAVQTLGVNCIKEACDEIGISYSMPPLPVEMKDKIA